MKFTVHIYKFQPPAARKSVKNELKKRTFAGRLDPRPLVRKKLASWLDHPLVYELNLWMVPYILSLLYQYCKFFPDFDHFAVKI